MRPCPSGFCSSVPEKRLRWNTRADSLVSGAEATFVASSANASLVNTYRQWSCPFVIIRPPRSSSRNFAGSVNRPLSSNLGVFGKPAAHERWGDVGGYRAPPTRATPDRGCGGCRDAVSAGSVGEGGGGG